jgi:hypothetical protein
LVRNACQLKTDEEIKTVKLENRHASIDVRPLGAMIDSAVFHLSDGRSVSPFFRAPWRGVDDPRKAVLPALLRDLGAEWACVPFGGPGARGDLPDEWQPNLTIADWDEHPHGLSSNHDWHLAKLGSGALRAEILYPPKAPIERLVREIRLDPDRAALQLSLEIHARRACRVPVGLHPIFDLVGLTPESAFLEIPQASKAWTFPIDVEPNRSRFMPDQRAADFSRLETGQGRVDIRPVPFNTASEDLVLLTNISDGLALCVPTRGYRVRVDWDRSMLPNCLLWFSNGGRDTYPWNGVTSAIGIEPTAAAFDLGLGYSLANDTPLAKHGVCTAVELSPERSWNTHYSIEVSGLK